MILKFDHWSGPLYLHCSIRRGDPRRIIERSSTGVIIQAISTEYADYRVIASAACRAIRAFESDRNLARFLDLEFLVRLTGTRQIREAIDRAEPGDEFVLVVASRDRKKVRGVLKELEGEAEELEEFPERDGYKGLLRTAASVDAEE
ncbi:KEOPS complex subunit Cgi121 [Methanopyrus kandleri]